MSRVAIDTHLHLYRSAEDGEQAKARYGVWEYGDWDGVQFSTEPGDVASALRSMDDAGVDAAVVTNLLDFVHPGVNPGQDLMDFNHWLCDLAVDEPRFVPLIAMDPSLLSMDESLRHLDEMVTGHGARGIKLHPPLQHLNLSDPQLSPLFEACVSLDVAIVSHSGPSRDGSGRGEPDSFRPLLAKFRDLRIVLAHLGGAAWRQSVALALDYPHVYFDLCEIVEWLGAPNAPTPSQMSALIRSIGTDRVMMGSDFPWYDISHTLNQVVQLPDLTIDEKDEILGGNAMRFFRIGS